jgi:hypothetical protein
MPGGRLTKQDREHIALWLAEGFGYAEIARRLGKPTSTISREVARNGGSDSYRADQAQQATGRRARRRKSALSTQLSATVDAYGRDPEAVRNFVEQFANLMIQTGVPRMPARVLTCLFATDSGTLTAAELVQYLQVSPASISKAIGYLEGLELVRRERDPSGRRERYIIDDDVWLRSWRTSAQTHTMWADAAQQGAKLLGTATPAGARLGDMGQFFAQLAEDMTGGATAATIDDALTVLAALVHASTPITMAQLATVLGWPLERVTSALHDAEQHPDITDPVTLRRTEPGIYTITARPNRLTIAQREALDHLHRRRQHITTEPTTSSPSSSPVDEIAATAPN